MPSSFSAAAAPAASSSARKVTVSAIPYDCTWAESTHVRPRVAGCLSVIGLAVARSALPVCASPARATWMKCWMTATRLLGGSAASSFCVPSRPSRSKWLPRKLPLPPWRISRTNTRFAEMYPSCSFWFSW